MATFPGTLIPWVQMTFVDANGDPLAAGKVAFKVTGTNTDKDTFDNADLDPSNVNTNPVILDADGRPTSGAIFLEPGGYDVFVYDEDDVLVYSVSGVEDVGATFLSQLGQTFSAGTRDAADGYTIDEDDFTVTLLPVAGGDYYLPSVVGRGQPVTLINKSPSVTATIHTFGGVQGFNGVVTTLTIPAGTSPIFSGVTLEPSTSDTSWFTTAYWQS
jgi:hypothetical protein